MVVLPCELDMASSDALLDIEASCILHTVAHPLMWHFSQFTALPVCPIRMLREALTFRNCDLYGRF